MTRSLVFVCAAVVLGGVTFAASARAHHGIDPIRIESGYIAGSLIGDFQDPVRIYRGIPYAAPPVGDLRWRAPQSPAKWSGIREAVTYGTHPVQFSGSQYPNAQGEDCLYLNVLTRAERPRAKLPVMVWFHGGGMTRNSGNDSTWNYHRLPQKGVVVVTVSTRLGPLGLLAHAALSAESPNGASGNYMYLDLVAALKWVQQNIGEFGGDAGNVTIWGQSGGGWKVGGLMTSPMATGLFHRAIIHSGGGPPAATKAVSETWGQQFFARLGVTTLEQARALPWEALVKASNAMPSPPGGGVTVDGGMTGTLRQSGGTISVGGQFAATDSSDFLLTNGTFTNNGVVSMPVFDGSVVSGGTFINKGRLDIASNTLTIASGVTTIQR